ncbi:hypothetical protein [Planococcus dechangensis]|uniref:Uncharacterized protein n=1 Tax=Planococcus dechangensis TaxID=1176255 RepID=A0ABV9M8Y1_9BACL
MIVLEYLKEFQGIIGAVIGLFSGYFLRNFGTVKSESLEFKHSPYDSGPFPGVQGYRGEEYSLLGHDFRGSILFENTSESSKSIKNLRIKAGNRTVNLKTPTEKKNMVGNIVFDDLNHLNIPAKSIVKAPIGFGFKVGDLDYQKGKKLYLEYEISGMLFTKSKKLALKIE